MEIRGKEVFIRPEVSPEKFVEAFCSVVHKKLTEKVDLEKLLEEEVEESLVLHWLECFHIHYKKRQKFNKSDDETSVVEAKKCRELLLKIALGEVEAYTSSITWDEVTWVVRKLFGVDLSIHQGKLFLRFPNVRLLAIKKSTIFKAQEIVEKYRLTPRDAIHAAAAIENKINTIISYDEDFDSLDAMERIEP